MCGSEALRHTTSGGLYPSVKVASLLSRYPVVVLVLYSRRVKIPGNPGTLGSGAVAATPDMVLQVLCTGARVGAGCKVGVPQACVWAIGKAGAGAGGIVVAPCFLVLDVPKKLFLNALTR